MVLTRNPKKLYVHKLFYGKDIIMFVRGRDKTKLYLLKVEEKYSVQDHIRKTTDSFYELSTKWK